jgi:glutathione synthase/RimK-type ligase-like ATP-grasp enzyme
MIPVFGDVRKLREFEERIAQRPDDVGALIGRACELDALGRTDEARDAYMEVIKRDPMHLAALTNLGTLLFNTGYRSAARLTYAEALKHHPRDLPSHVNLANALLEAGRIEEARRLYESALAIDENFAAAHQGLSYALTRLGEDRAAEEHRRLGFGPAPIAIARYRGEGVPITVLLLVSAVGGNVATELALDDRTVMTVKLFTEYYEQRLPLPPHDVIFNAIGDADMCGDALEAASRLIRKSKARVINHPERIKATGRAQIAVRLRGIDGLIAPRIERVHRSRLHELDMPFPLLLRSPGYHTGEHFVLVQEPAQAAAAAQSLPGDELLALEYLNARGPDGAFRKYRVLFIGGELFPLHLARSSTWKVHYFTADLAATLGARAEETAFLSDMDREIGYRALRALAEVRDRLNLDYAGIDFALDSRGNVLLFEANATMKVVRPAAHDPSTARRIAADRALAAMRGLVRNG